MTSSGWSRPAFGALSRLVGKRAGLRFDPHRSAPAEEGMRRAMARANVLEPDRYLELLEAGRASFEDLVGELTIGETYFFRDPGQLDFLSREALPDLLRRRGPEHVLRVWSAGCASGEEAYSLAILLTEQGFGERMQILAWDISMPALARAREAVYGRWSLRGIDRAVLSRHFSAQGERQVLDDAVRRRVRFEYGNLAEGSYPSLASGVWGMDVVFCRNVLIYFDRATIARVAAQLFGSLAPGGWLIAGASDPPLSEYAPFEAVVAPEGVFYRRASGEARTSKVVPVPSWPDRPEASIEPPALVARRSDELLREEPISEPQDALAAARAAFAAGDYGRARKLALGVDRPEAVALGVRAAANGADPDEALAVAEQAAMRHPLCAELHFLHGLLLIEAGRLDAAIGALRRVLYLDRSLAVAHFALAGVLRRQGDVRGARRAYRNAADLARSLPKDEPLALGEGERAGELAVAVALQLALLDRASELAP